MPHALTSMPQLNHPVDCVEECITTSGLADFSPTTRVPPSLRFGGTPGPVQLVDGNYFPYTARDGAGLIECAVGRYRTGPIRIERPSNAACIYYSSSGNSPVDFGTGATLNILGGCSGKEFEKLTGNDQTLVGGLYQIAPHDWARRVMVNNAPFLTLSQANGVAGPPTFDPAYGVLRTAGGTEAERTMVDELVLTALSTKFLGASHKWRGNAADIGLLLTRIGAQNYKAEMEVAGVLRQLMLREPIIQVEPATSISVVALDVAAETAVTLIVPNFGGPYHISVTATVHGNVSLSAGSGSSSVIAHIQMLATSEGLGVYTTVASAPLYLFLSGADSVANQGAITVHYDLPTPPDLGENYFFRVLPVVSGGAASLNAGSDTDGIRLHSIRAVLSNVQ